MDIARERSKPAHGLDVRLVLQNCLVVVRDAPSLRNVELEERRQLRRGLSRHDVAPRAERHEKPALFVERKISVHHARHAERCQLREMRAVFRRSVGNALCIRVAHARLDIFERIAPDAVDQLVLPVVRALRDNLEAVVDKHRLDARRAELNAHHCLARFDKVFHKRCLLFLFAVTIKKLRTTLFEDL